MAHLLCRHANSNRESDLSEVGWIDAPLLQVDNRWRCQRGAVAKKKPLRRRLEISNVQLSAGSIGAKEHASAVLQEELRPLDLFLRKDLERLVVNRPNDDDMCSLLRSQSRQPAISRESEEERERFVAENGRKQHYCLVLKF